MGFILTSNPSFPDDITIQIRKHSDPSDPTNVNENFIVEYSKTDKTVTFASENAPISLNHSWVSKLVESSVIVDETLGASELEFVVSSNDEVYLVQQRQITDLNHPEPSLDKLSILDNAELLGTTRVRRGSGLHEYPIVVVPDLEERLLGLSPTISALRSMDNTAAASELKCSTVKDWMDRVEKLDLEYSEGYFLVTPHFNDTNFGVWNLLADRPVDTNFDSLTPNKRGMVTAKYQSVASHAMTLTREKGLVYASFSESEFNFDALGNGDLCALHFDGRDAHFYLIEKSFSLAPDLTESFSKEKFVVNRDDDGWTSITINEDSSSCINNFCGGLETYLIRNTGQSWTFEPFEVSIGGLYTNSNNETFALRAFRKVGDHITFILADASVYVDEDDPVIAEDVLKKLSNDLGDYLENSE